MFTGQNSFLQQKTKKFSNKHLAETVGHALTKRASDNKRVKTPRK